MADKLTPQQHQAVHDRGGRLLVSAAAGSGKTKVLVDRLMTYLTDPHAPANLDDFLIITYTKAAASELRGKIAAKLTEKIAQEPQNRHLQKQMQRLYLTKISTVHGFCADILREYAYRLDLSADFRVADENECRELRNQAMEDMLDKAYQNAGNDEDFRWFVDTQGLGRDDRMVPEIIEKVYDSARCHLDPERWLQSCLEAAQLDTCTDAGETVWGKYLMLDLFEYLDCQIRALACCANETESYPELAKVSLNLNATLQQLQALRASNNWDAIVENRSIDYGRMVFPKKNPDPDLADRIKAVRNACKKGLERKLNAFADKSEQVMEDLSQSAFGVRGLIALVQQFDHDYSALKRSRRCLDFSDLEHKTLDLLLGKSRSGATAAAEEIGKRFREIMVDEYQDSNGVQDAIFTVLTERKQNCFLVGDVKQSIYQFRLADPGIFLEKYHAYVPAEEAQAGQGRKVFLSHNFRSGKEVISCVNDVFSACMRPKVGGLHYGEEEALREGIPQDTLPDAAVELCAIEVREETYPEEAAFVADRIQKMLSQGTQIRDRHSGLRPVQPEDIVILLRSPGSAAGYFQRALEERGIRCTSGSGTDLLKTQEIATFRSFLQTIWNPRQDIPLLSTLASPIFGFTADDLAAIRAKHKKGCFYEALLEDESEKTVQFLLILSQLRTHARMDTLTGLLEQCFTLTRLDSIYAAMTGGDVKAANLQAFFQLASEFENGSLRDLPQFLDHLQALEERGLAASAEALSGAVTIMSIHKSKGLEFPVVFLCNLSRKFNQENLRAQILCDKSLGLGLSVADSKTRIRYPSIAKRAIAVKMAAESVSEEMRVLYVAMTRARDRLIMTYASRTMASDLQEIAMRMDSDGGELLCRDAICFGDWILMAALRRTEAGELHGLGGRPLHTKIGDYPWKISLADAPETEAVTEMVKDMRTIPESVLSQLKEHLAFTYGHEAAMTAPSKQTATDRKGRLKDAEAAENAEEPKKIRRIWRKPTFGEKATDGLAYGNAMHAAMQYIRYEACGSEAETAQEIQRLVQLGLLSKEQGQLVRCDQIAAFFATDIGKKLYTGANCLREFKFSILDDGSQYGDGLHGEQVLLQGVVDCAILDEDGIVVLDFKTDHVTEQTLGETVAHYRSQVNAYADALHRIYEMPIKAKYLFFFRLGGFVSL